MQLRLYLQAVQRGWWLIVLTTLSALSVSLTLSYLATPRYRAAARFIISPNTALMTGRDIVNSLDTLDRRSISATYAEAFASERLYDDTLRLLGVTRADLLEYTRQAAVLPDSSVLELSVTGPNPLVTASLANAIGENGIDYVSRLSQVYVVTFLDAAQVPEEPFSPQPLRDAGLAILLGFAASTVLTILHEQIQAPLDALRRRFAVDQASSAFNRRHFQRVLEETVARRAEGNVALGLVHLDGLSDLMDYLPPAITQSLLHEVHARLRDLLRGNDIVGRWGNIRFSVLLPSTPAVAAERTLDRIRDALAAPIRLANVDEEMHLEPYVGVSVSQPGEAPESLIARVEAELDHARQVHLAGHAVS